MRKPCHFVHELPQLVAKAATFLSSEFHLSKRQHCIKVIASARFVAFITMHYNKLSPFCVRFSLLLHQFER